MNEMRFICTYGLEKRCEPTRQGESPCEKFFYVPGEKRIEKICMHRGSEYFSQPVKWQPIK